MSKLPNLKQRLARVSRLSNQQDYDQALSEVESLLKDVPGNAHLYILWARLVQLQEAPTHELDEVKEALQSAVSLDPDSPAASIELACFQDNVEDDPEAAAKSFAMGIASARRILIEALIGYAKTLHQLEKNAELARCIVEIIGLASFEQTKRRSFTDDSLVHWLLSQWTTGGKPPSESPYAKQIQELMEEVA
jgi:hypothetical protein